MKKNDKKAYSIIVIIIIIGFLLVLSSGVFRLVFNEMKDNQVIGNYIKTYAGAESGKELAMLMRKKFGKNYIDGLDKNSDILNKNCGNNCVSISYNYDSYKKSEYEKEIEAGHTATFYLSYYEGGKLSYINSIDFKTLTSGVTDDNVKFVLKDIKGNILLEGSQKDFNNATSVTYTSIKEIYDSNTDSYSYLTETKNETIGGLLGDNKKAVSLSVTPEIKIKYKIKVESVVGGKILPPEAEIHSSGEYKNFATNLKTNVGGPKLELNVYSETPQGNTTQQ